MKDEGGQHSFCKKMLSLTHYSFHSSRIDYNTFLCSSTSVHIGLDIFVQQPKKKPEELTFTKHIYVVKKAELFY